MSQAEQLRDNPNDDVREFLAIAQESSAASQSTCRRDFECEDGSSLIAESHNGGEVTFRVGEWGEV